ncbi:TPA: hypothetical protein HA251_04190 [Candidatus Woesearchaeota archaeon]|nr:hypothetical protein [Candidatus Woesearchaeota archaeon]
MARILVSPLNWGLGHATRDIPIIKELLRHGHEVTIAGEGRCVSLLKKEFPEAEHLRFPDYPSPYTASRHFLPKITSMLPKLFAAFKDERLRFEALQRKRKFDMVISDNRFGVAAKDAPSFFISHQLRYATPWYLPVETATAAFNATFHKRFTGIIVPDAPGSILSGRLSKNPITPKGKVHFAGILTSIERHDVRQDIDYLVAISGPEPQRTILEKRMREQLPSLSGKTVMLLARPDIPSKTERVEHDVGGATIMTHASRDEMSRLMCRAKFIVTRSGYTTMMELAELRKRKGIFTPTPGQTEQEYLSMYYRRKGWFLSRDQDRLDLSKDIDEARKYKGFPTLPGSAKNARKLYDDVLGPSLRR